MQNGTIKKKYNIHIMKHVIYDKKNMKDIKHNLNMKDTHHNSEVKESRRISDEEDDFMKRFQSN